MGLDFPILFNSAKTRLSSLVLGLIELNLSITNSKAAKTSGVSLYLLSNSAASLTLEESSSTSLEFKISN